MLTQLLRTLAIIVVIMAVVGAIFAIAPANSAPQNGAPPQGRGGTPGQVRPAGGRGGQQSLISNIVSNSGSVLAHFVAVSVVTLVVVLIERGIRSQKRNQIDDTSEAEFANL